MLMSLSLTSAVPALVLKPVQGLGLECNQITAIPDSLAQLTNLQGLGLGCNQITAILEFVQRALFRGMGACGPCGILEPVS
jgi:Leucine-rich repeat (LRR) protein